ncbi:MAG: glycosyltransferase family 2 protein [Chloroflexota bacterium]|nr:MAG: glycosyltransferase family 2 protein [Chloroflexota bacterium]
MGSPLVSIIIVNWNHGRYLQDCLDSLSVQEFKEFEIYIVDNGSTDGSIERIIDRDAEIIYWTFPNNLGFCKAFNWGVDHTESEFVLSLNPDVFVQEDFLREMVKTISQEERVGIVSAKLLRDDDPTILDSTGLFIDRRRRPTDRGQGQPDKGQYDDSWQIFGACGAAALYRRTMLEDIALSGQYFDEDFFAYYEDADLAWRAQSRGWKARYAPSAVATHVRGWGDTLRKRRQSIGVDLGPRLALRNRYWMIVKNDNLRYFLLDFPLIFVTELPRLFYMALFAPEGLLGIRDFFLGYRSSIEKRKLIREKQTVDDDSLRSWFNPRRSRAG